MILFREVLATVAKEVILGFEGGCLLGVLFLLVNVFLLPLVPEFH